VDQEAAGRERRDVASPAGSACGGPPSRHRAAGASRQPALVRASASRVQVPGAARPWPRPSTRRTSREEALGPRPPRRPGGRRARGPGRGATQVPSAMARVAEVAERGAEPLAPPPGRAPARARAGASGPSHGRGPRAGRPARYASSSRWTQRGVVRVAAPAREGDRARASPGGPCGRRRSGRPGAATPSGGEQADEPRRPGPRGRLWPAGGRRRHRRALIGHARGKSARGGRRQGVRYGIMVRNTPAWGARPVALNEEGESHGGDEAADG
jgi:hypothetical protein